MQVHIFSMCFSLTKKIEYCVIVLSENIHYTYIRIVMKKIFLYYLSITLITDT